MSSPGHGKLSHGPRILKRGHAARFSPKIRREVVDLKQQFKQQRQQAVSSAVITSTKNISAGPQIRHREKNNRTHTSNHSPQHSILMAAIRGLRAKKVKLDQRDPKVIRAGDAVRAAFRNSELWYDGVITKVNDDHTYNVRYDDGAKELNKPRKFVKKLRVQNPIDPIEDIQQYNNNSLEKKQREMLQKNKKRRNTRKIDHSQIESKIDPAGTSSSSDYEGDISTPSRARSRSKARHPRTNRSHSRETKKSENIDIRPGSTPSNTNVSRYDKYGPPSRMAGKNEVDQKRNIPKRTTSSKIDIVSRKVWGDTSLNTNENEYIAEEKIVIGPSSSFRSKESTFVPYSRSELIKLRSKALDLHKKASSSTKSNQLDLPIDLAFCRLSWKPQEILHLSKWREVATDAALHRILRAYPKSPLGCGPSELFLSNCEHLSYRTVETIATNLYASPPLSEELTWGPNKRNPWEPYTSTYSGLRTIHAQNCHSIRFRSKLKNIGLGAAQKQRRYKGEEYSQKATRILGSGLCRVQFLDLSGNIKLLDSDIQVVSETMPMLKYLSVAGCKSIGDRSAKFIVAGCPRLKAIDFSGCNNYNDGHGLTDVGLKFLVGDHVNSGLPLTVLRIADCFEISDIGFQAIAGSKSAGNTLRTLDVSGCKRIGDQGARHLVETPLFRGGLMKRAKGLQALTSLDISFLSEMTGLAVAWICAGCPQLQRVTMIELSALDDNGCDSIGSLRALSGISLCRCSSVTDAGVVGMANIVRNRCEVERKTPYVQEINISGCKALGDASVAALGAAFGKSLLWADISELHGLEGPGLAAFIKKSSNLLHLSLRRCYKVETRALKYIGRECRRLIYLDISHCIGVTDDTIVSLHHLKHLRVLDLTMCTKLTDSGVGYVPNDGLKQLFLDGISLLTDAGITTIAEKCHNLRVLHCVGCKLITPVSPVILFKECKKLRELNVLGCPNIRPSLIASLAALRPRTASINEPDKKLDLSTIDHRSFLPRLSPAVLRHRSSTDAAEEAYQRDLSADAVCGLIGVHGGDLGDGLDDNFSEGSSGNNSALIRILSGETGSKHRQPHRRRFAEPTSLRGGFRGVRPVKNSIGLLQQDQCMSDISRQRKAVNLMQSTVRAFTARLRFRKLIKGVRQKKWDAAQLVQARWRGRGTRSIFQLWALHKQHAANIMQKVVLRRLTRRRCWMLKRFAVKWWRLEARELHRNAIQLRYVMHGWFAYSHMRYLLEKNHKKIGMKGLRLCVEWNKHDRRSAADAFMGAVDTETFNSSSSIRWLRKGDRYYATCLKRRMMRGWWLGVMQARLLKRKAKTFYLKMFASGVTLVLLSWRGYAEKRLEQKARYQEADKFARIKKIRRSVQTWHRIASVRAEQGRRLRKAVMFMTNGLLVRSWMNWNYMVKERKAMRRAAAHLLNRRLSQVWYRWGMFVQIQLEEKRKMAKALRWMKHGAKMKFFHLWKDWLKRRKDLVRRTIARMLFKYLAGGFFQWMDWYNEHKRRGLIAARVQALWRGRMARDGYDDYRIDMNWATTKIQTFYRGNLGKKRAWKQARMNRIKEYMEINEPEMALMALEEEQGILFRAMFKVARAFQRIFRGEKGRLMAQLQKRVRNKSEQLKRAVRKQQILEEVEEKQAEREKTRELEYDAAVKLQVCWKRKVATRYLEMLRKKAREKGATIKAQQMYRCRLGKRAAGKRRRLLEQRSHMRERRAEAGKVYRFFRYMHRRQQLKVLTKLAYMGMWPDSYHFKISQHKKEIMIDAARFFRHMKCVSADIADFIRQQYWAWQHGVQPGDANVLQRTRRSQYPQICPGMAVRIIDRSSRLCGEEGYVLNILRKGTPNAAAEVVMDKDDRIIVQNLRYDFTKSIKNRPTLDQVPKLEFETIPYARVVNSRAELFALAEDSRIRNEQNRANTLLAKIIRGRNARKRHKMLYAEWMVEIEERREEVFRILSKLNLANMTIGRLLVRLKLVRPRELPPQLPEIDIIDRILGGGKDAVAAFRAHRAVMAELSSIRAQQWEVYKRDLKLNRDSPEEDEELPWRSRTSINMTYRKMKLKFRKNVTWKLASKIKHRANLIDLYDELPEGGNHTDKYEKRLRHLANSIAGRQWYWNEDQMASWVGNYRMDQLANSPHVPHHLHYPGAAGMMVVNGAWKDGKPHGPGTAWLPAGVGKEFHQLSKKDTDNPLRWIKYQEIDGYFENGSIPSGSDVQILYRNRSIYEGPYVEFGQDPSPSHWGKWSSKFGEAERYDDKNTLIWEGRLVDNHFNEYCINGWIKGTWITRKLRRRKHLKKAPWKTETYEGFYVNSKKHGYGVMKYKNKKGEYSGEWRCDKRHGHGSFRDKKGSVYIGEWFNGKKHGWGVESIIEPREQYEGNFCDGLRDGNGTLVLANSDKYVGEFQGGIRHGKGVVFYANGNRYEGPYVQGIRHGDGILTFKDAGERYEGPFVNDLMHGKGIFVKTRSAGYHQKRRGIWKRGNHVRWTGWCVSKFATDAFLSQFGVPCEDDPKPYKDPDWVKRMAEKSAKEAAEKEKKAKEDAENAIKQKRQEAKKAKAAARRAKGGKGGVKGKAAKQKELDDIAEKERLRKEEIRKRKMAREEQESDVEEEWEPPGGWDVTTFDGVYAAIVAEKLPALPDGVDPDNFVVKRVVDRIMGKVGPASGDQMLKRARESLAKLTPLLKAEIEKEKAVQENLDTVQEEAEEQTVMRDDQRQTMKDCEDELLATTTKLELFWEEDVHKIRHKYNRSLGPLKLVKQREWHHLKTMKDRPKVIEQVMESACLMLGLEPRWRLAEELCNSSAANQTRGVADSFLNDYDCKLVWMITSGQWNVYDIAENHELFEKLQEYFYNPVLKANNPDIFEVSMPASRVCMWFRRAFLYARMANQCKHIHKEKLRLTTQLGVEKDTTEDEEEILLEITTDVLKLTKKREDVRDDVKEMHILERRLLRTIKKIEERMTELQVQKAEEKLNAKGGIRESLESGEITEFDILGYLRDENFVMLGALVQAGMSPNWHDSYGNTLLIVAAQNTQFDAVKYLCENIEELDVNHQNKNGNTALHYAIAYFPGGEIVPYLMDKGADDTLKNRFGLSPYDGTTAEDTIEFQDQSEDALMTLLTRVSESVVKGEKNILQEEWIDERYNCDQPDRNGWTILHHLALAADAKWPEGLAEEIAQMLFDAGATGDPINEDGNSALHFALGRNPAGDLGPLIIEYGGDDGQINKWGQTPYEGYCDQSWRGICAQKDKEVPFWQLSIPLAASLQLNESRIAAEKPGGMNISDDAWTTAVVLRCLDIKCSDDQDLWGDIYATSRKWLKKQCTHAEFPVIWENTGELFGL